MTPKITWIFVAALGPFLGSCNVLGTACPDAERPGIELEIRDARTGAPAAAGATAVAHDDDKTYPFEADRPLGDSTALVLSAFTEPGVYDVVIQKAGYRDWTASNVRVRKDGECYVRTVHLQAQLQRVP